MSTPPRPRRARLRVRVAVVAESLQFPRFEKCAVERLAAHRTASRALDVSAAKPLSCDTAAPVHDSCAKPLTNDVIWTRDPSASCVALSTELCSALDLTPTRPVSCAHRVLREDSIIRIAQVNTRCTLRDADWKYLVNADTDVTNFASLLPPSRCDSRSSTSPTLVPCASIVALSSAPASSKSSRSRRFCCRIAALFRI